ncbi:MSP domain-containing protein [Loa loa]|uniref:MSP domain-containing protein n=1 Tax=Loa loa TaxID=7209 RepID=A0A1I7VFD3_LOALO|nr:MSP domain-containing protein [Loa loa]EFO26164.1 MSP domain-containing protein [Loa loa]
MLTVQPRAVQIRASGGTCIHKLINTSIARLAFKIKCTNNDEYRFKPIYGFIEPQCSYPIVVQKLSGTVREDIVIVQYAEVTTDCIDPKAPFKVDALQGEIIIYAHSV